MTDSAVESGTPSGTVAVSPPGDKSISHRVLMLAPLARGESRIRGLLDAADVRSTAAAMRALGAGIPGEWDSEIVIAGPAPWRDPAARIDCGNSGTTARILTGLIVGLGRAAEVDGDASLRARPMERVVYPLQAMGGRISYLETKGRLPLRTKARATGSLRRLRHRPRVASAQVKSSLLLAGLASGVRVEVIEPGRSRDHTERLLRAMGAPIEFGPEEPGARAVLEAASDARSADGHPTARPAAHDLQPLDVRVPGDVSSAAFLAGAAALGARAPVRLEDVGLNPTRTGFVEVMRRMGAEIRSERRATAAGEPVGDLWVERSELSGFELGPDLVPRVLDEIPLLAVLAARAEGRSRIRGAAELRVKESDRLSLLAENLEELGVAVREQADGLEIEGTGKPLAGRIRTGGDHRMAMAFGVLGGLEGCRLEIDDPDCVRVSYPGFRRDLRRVLA